MKILYENYTDSKNYTNSTSSIEENNKCDMFGSFGLYVQIILAGLSFLILICKRK